MWCSGIAGIYAQLGGQFAMDICALYYICNLFGVMVLQTSMLAWSVVGSICHGYMVYCATYDLVWCNGFPDTHD